MLIRGQNAAPVVIRAIGGLLTILPRAVNRAVPLVCACHLLFCGLSPVILRLVTLLGGTTYTTPQVAAAVSGPVTTAVRGLLVRRSRYLLC